MQEMPTGVVMRKKSGDEKEFVLRRCCIEDLDAIVDLQEAVYDALEEKTLFVKTKRDEFAESLELDQCFCFMDEDRMAAFTLMVAGRPGYRNYGEYLGYSPEEIAKTVSMDTTFVHPNYRGYGLQKYFFDLRERVAKEVLGAEQALTTISSENVYSLNNARRSGFEEIKRVTIYGGLERCILRKML